MCAGDAITSNAAEDSGLVLGTSGVHVCAPENSGLSVHTYIQ